MQALLVNMILSVMSRSFLHRTAELYTYDSYFISSWQINKTFIDFLDK